MRMICQQVWRPVALLLLAVFLAGGCNHANNAEKSQKPVEVIATTPITDEVMDYQDYVGRLDALKTVEIRAKVSGYVMEAPFKEGDLVHEGDLLFLIDQRPYQAALNQAEANVKLTQADRNLQEKNAVRAKKIITSNSISQEDYDSIVAALEKTTANVGVAQAARDLAKLNLDYTRVTAPFTGRISRRFVDPGNLIQAETTNVVLTTLVIDTPLYAYFDVDERAYLNLVGTKPGQGSVLTQMQFPVLMRTTTEEEYSRAGTVNFIDNHISPTSGTIRMRAIFPNADSALKSGLFVRLRLPIGRPYQAVLIPDEALMSDQGRKYLYVVNKQNEVEYRLVDLGQQIHGLRVIKQNLAMGERVITGGMQRVRPKAVVEVKMTDPPKPPESPLKLLVKEEKNRARQADKKAKKDEETKGDKERGKS